MSRGGKNLLLTHTYHRAGRQGMTMIWYQAEVAGTIMVQSIVSSNPEPGEDALTDAIGPAAGDSTPRTRHFSAKENGVNEAERIQHDEKEWENEWRLVLCGKRTTKPCCGRTRLGTRNVNGVQRPTRRAQHFVDSDDGALAQLQLEY